MGRPMKRAMMLALCAALAACGPQGKVYPEPEAKLHDELSKVDELPPVFGESDPDLRVESSDPGSVSWVVSLDGSEVMRFVARLEPKGDQATRMNLDLVGATSTRHGDVQARMDTHPEIRRLYLVAMGEQIDSMLEHRTFDITKTYGALAAATAANIGTISRQM